MRACVHESWATKCITRTSGSSRIPKKPPEIKWISKRTRRRSAKRLVADVRGARAVVEEGCTGSVHRASVAVGLRREHIHRAHHSDGALWACRLTVNRRVFLRTDNGATDLNGRRGLRTLPGCITHSD